MIQGKVIKAIIPARMTSSRLPGKMMLDIAGKPNLQRVIERTQSSQLIDGVVIAFTTNKEDDCLEEFCITHNYEYFRGSENDVLDRIIKAARITNTDVVVELTSDCPLIWYRHIDYLIDWHMQDYPNFDMTTNIEKRTFPRGFDIRIVNIESLERSQTEISNDVDRQHALTFMYLNPEGRKNYKVQNWSAPPGQNRPDIEVTLDEPDDLLLINFIYGFESQGYNLELSCSEVIGIINAYPAMYEKVAKIKRKDYFQELEECYAKQNIDKEVKENESIPSIDSGLRSAGRRGRPRKESQ